MHNTLKYSLIITSLMLVLTTFIIQINSPEYNCAIYVIACIYSSFVLILTIVKCIRNNLSIKKYRFFLGLMCSFLLSELPVIYCYRDAEHTIQQDASHYIQALTFILIFGLISMIVVNVIKKRGS